MSSLGFGSLHCYLSLPLLQNDFGVVSNEMSLYIGTSLALSVAVLSGINISLIIYRFKRSGIIINKLGSSIVAGSAFTVFSPERRVCTIPLVVILETVGSLVFLQNTIIYNLCAQSDDARHDDFIYIRLMM